MQRATQYPRHPAWTAADDIGYVEAEGCLYPAGKLYKRPLEDRDLEAKKP